MVQHLLFNVGEQRFGLPISEMDKIVTLKNHTVIPDVSPYIVGLQDVDGDVLAIIELSSRLYGQSEYPSEGADVIVVNWKDTHIGLLVTEVTVVEDFATNDVTDASDEKVDGVPASYISAFIQKDDGVIPILDTHYLFAEDKGEELRKIVDIETVKA